MLVNDLSHLTPSEAHRKVAYVQLRLWQEQYKENWFIKDPRPEKYLKYELAAFYQGYIDEIHGWTDPIGQVADWAIKETHEMLLTLWNDVFQPGISAIVSGFSWIWNSIKDTAGSIWDWVQDIYNKLVEVDAYIAGTIFTYLHDAWNWLRNIKTVIYHEARGAVNLVYWWLKDAETAVVNSMLRALKTYVGFLRGIWDAGFSVVRAAIQNLHEATESAWHSLVETVSGKFEALTHALSALPHSIAAGFQTAISYLYDVLKRVWGSVILPAGHKIVDALKWIANKLVSAFYTVTDTISNILSSVAPLTPEKAPNLTYSLMKVTGLAAGGLLGMAGIWDLIHPFKEVIPGEIKAMIYDVTSFNKILGAFTGALFTVSIAQPMKYYYNAELRPYIPSWGDIMELKSRGKLDDDTFRRFMHYHGYDDIYKPYFDELANTPAGYFMLRMMAEQGFFDENIFKEEIARLGYAKPTQEFLFETFKRTATEPVKGLYSSYVVNRYVVGITSLDELEREAASLGYFGPQIKQIRMGASLRDDYENVKDAISALQYSYRHGDITLDEFKARLAALGLRSDKIAQYAMIEQLRAKEEVGTTQEEEVRAYGRSTAIKRFKEGMTTPVELEQELRLMGYSEQWIRRLELVARLERDYDFAMTVLSAVKKAWKSGKIGDGTFIELLRRYGFTDEKIALELDLLKLEKGLLPGGGGEA